MKKLLILSGKGGTGKTTTAAAFIRFSEAKAFADCDVDAPNLHIVNHMDSVPKRSDYYGSKKSFIDPAKCVGCQACLEACRFDAIIYKNEKCVVNEYACEGCGVCAFVCPTGAAKLYEDVAGELTLYKDTRVFSTAELKMGRGNSGLLVSEVKSAMIKAAPDPELVIIDGSPGIGCPVIASVSGVDLALIVTEPSVSGMSDLERILKTASILRTKVAVCINKYNACIEQANKIEAYCKENDVPFMGRIPYDEQASVAINAGKSLAEIDCPARDALKQVYDKTIELLEKNML